MVAYTRPRQSALSWEVGRAPEAPTLAESLRIVGRGSSFKGVVSRRVTTLQWMIILFRLYGRH